MHKGVQSEKGWWHCSGRVTLSVCNRKKGNSVEEKLPIYELLQKKFYERQHMYLSFYRYAGSNPIVQMRHVSAKMCGCGLQMFDS